MNFSEAENYLLSLGNEVLAMKLGLENVSRLFVELGNPEREYLKVQVAGTNGKGSVCAFLNSICVTAEIKTGMYTSPHLVSITERIQIDGAPIGEDEFARLASIVRAASEKLVERKQLEHVPTFFEQVTAIALLAFAEAKVDLAILETGLGGRLDATTAANAEIAAITRIDLDHQQYLGETIEEIASEKAAIIHPESRVVVGDQEDNVMQVIISKATKLDVAPRLASHVVLPLEKVELGLPGRHQIENAKVAGAIAELLRDRFRISDHQIVAGLESARHPGRLERVGNFLLDGAHNVGGARALRNYLNEFVTSPLTIIFGAMEDKNVDDIASILFPNADYLILTEPSNPRAIPVEQLLPTATDHHLSKRVFVAPKPTDAVVMARELAGREQLILVTGSLYLVGEVREILLPE